MGTAATDLDLELAPAQVLQAFMDGLEDVAIGRTVPVDEALKEGRRRIAEFRARNGRLVDGQALHHSL